LADICEEELENRKRNTAEQRNKKNKSKGLRPYQVDDFTCNEAESGEED
jgi:hypothetical protein